MFDKKHYYFSERVDLWLQYLQELIQKSVPENGLLL